MTLSALCKRLQLTLPMIALLLLASGCGIHLLHLRTSRSVPQGEFLLKENQLVVEGDKVDKDEMEAVIRQQPNLSALSVPALTPGRKRKKGSTHLKFRLYVYNIVDSAAVEKGRHKRMEHYRHKNEKKKKRQTNINQRRQAKAKAKGEKEYEFKVVKLKDTLSPKPKILERMKYRFGEPPVIADSAMYARSKSQLSTYLHKKGFYYDTITAYVDTVRNNRRSRKIIHHYKAVTGPRYYIDTVVLVSGNSDVKGAFRKYIERERQDSPLNEPFYRFLTGTQKEPMKVPFDQDLLTSYRDKVARYMRNETLYGFSPSNITYEADTTGKDFRVKLYMEFSERKVIDPKTDKAVTVPFVVTSVSEVYFDFERDAFTVENDSTVMIRDTFYFAKLRRHAELPEGYPGKSKKNMYYKSTVRKNIFGQWKDSIAPNPFRMAYFTYDVPVSELERRIARRGKVDTSRFIPLKPGVLEAQNYLEYTNYYKEYYQERSYSRIAQLGVFSTIGPDVRETYPGSGKLLVHYHLVPNKKHSVGFEPRTTYSNGLLGVNASVNYSNKNLFRSGWIMTTAFSGGFESNPLVFSQDDDKGVFKNLSLNTFEYGPSLKFDLPGFFPIKVERLPKRGRPRTVLSTAYNYQKRPDFDRGVFQLNYLWKIYVGKTQVISIGLPTTSVIKFVAINKSEVFETRLIEAHDQFLANSYSDQLIWEDMKLVYEYDNRDSDRRREKGRNKLRVTFTSSFDLAGNTLSAFKSKYKMDTLNHYLVFGVPYSQFGIVDTKFILYYNVTKNKVLAFKLLAGGGVPYGNLPTSLPYDYSFFAGGANDNRGWSTRSLGPGSYQYYLDTNRTATQIGDIRLGSSVELRFGGAGLIKHALFADIGNIWTLKYDVNRKGSQISKNFHKELGLALGYGLRLDFGFFILRCDIGFPITNPALPEGARWIFQSRQPYTNAMNTVYGNPDNYPNDLKKPFEPLLHFGIGLPF